MLFHSGQARAQTPADDMACAQGLSQPVLAKWLGLGGAHGLGCPAAPELAAPVSPRGTAAREVKFDQGAILWHASGPRTGQTFAVSGCMYRLYFQYGGPSGWLGLPTSDPINTPDGQRQTFEGGVMTFQRVDSSCEAEPGATTTALAASAHRSAGPVLRCLARRQSRRGLRRQRRARSGGALPTPTDRGVRLQRSGSGPCSSEGLLERGAERSR